MATTLNAGNATSGAAISADTTGILQLQSGSTPTTAVTVDTSQNVGVGITSPAYKLDAVVTGNSINSIIAARNTTSGTSAGSQILVGNDSSNDLLVMRALSSTYTSSGVNTANGALVRGGGAGGMTLAATDGSGIINFATGGTTERMRIDSSGNLLVGTTNSSIGNNFTTVGTANSALNLNSSGTSGTYTTLGFYNQNSYQAQIYWQQSNDNFYVQNNNNGVYLSANATSWTANSDERLKENLVPIENGLEKVCSLRSVIGNFKSDENKKPTPFLIAQDVQAVLPEAISSSTIKGDETETEYLGVAYTEVIPLLVASIKELNAKVEAQALEIQALKGTA
jgi:hypothetical protein